MTSESHGGVVALSVPAPGILKFLPPEAMCGELEVYEAGGVIARVASSTGWADVLAPARGFLRQRLVNEDMWVEAGRQVAWFSVT